MNNNSTSFKSIKTSTAFVERIHVDIVVLRYDEEFEHETLETVQENLDALFELGNNAYDACLIIPSKYALPSVEGRKLIEKELSKFPCVAVVLKGLAQKILLDFVASVIGRTKMKVFTNEEDALEWLLEKIDDE